MFLDGATLLTIALILTGFASFIWLLSAFLFKSSPTTSINFALSNISLGAFMFFYVGRSHWPTFTVYVLSDITVVLGCLMLTRATQKFNDVKNKDWQLLVLFSIALVLDLFARSYNLKNLALVAVCGVSLIGMFEAWRNAYSYMIKSFAKVYCIVTTFPLIVMGLLLSVRIFIALVFPEQIQATDLRNSNQFNTGFLIVMILSLLGFNATAIGLVISKMINQIRVLSQEDPLTQAFNRRHLNDIAEQEINKVKKGDEPLSIVLLDIDHFKKVNDSYGHAAGDAALVSCVNTIRKNIRSTDYIGRLGGEEFCILLPKTSTNDAKALAERIRLSIESTPVLWEGKLIPITASFGITTFNSSTKNEWSNLLNKADIAMYQAKHNGRNQVVLN